MKKPIIIPVDDPNHHLTINISKSDNNIIISTVNIYIDEIIDHEAKIDQWFPLERTSTSPIKKNVVSKIRIEIKAEKSYSNDTIDINNNTENFLFP
jgi:hypothetical protein